MFFALYVIMSCFEEVKLIAYNLVRDYANEGESITVGNFLSIFKHPDVTELRLHASAWLGHYNCTTDDILDIDHITGYLFVPAPEVGTDVIKLLI
jgi:hypothetical protein